jgi:hypothetical protein
MTSLQIALTAALAIMVSAAPTLAQTGGAPGSLPGPAGPTVPGPAVPGPAGGPSVGPAVPGDTRPTTPGMPPAPMPRTPSGSPSASPPTSAPTTTVPATRNDCVGGGWTRYPTQAFANEADCAAWLNKQGK